MAVLYGLLVLLIGGALLYTSYLLLDRAITEYPLLSGTEPITIINQNYPNGAQVYPKDIKDSIRTDALHYLLNNGLLYFGMIVIIGTIGGYLLATQALRPVARITATARRLSTKTLSERIGLGGPEDELRELADTFDDMLGRLDAAFSSQRRFVANASHELRTPLAVIQTELDVTLSDTEASVEELRRMGEVVRDAANRAQRLVDALLALARLQGREGQELEVTETVVIHELFPNAIAAAEAEAVLRGVTISSEGDVVESVGDPRLLERVVGNLVENAVRYNVTGGWVRIRTQSAERDGLGVARIIVANSGVQVAPEEVDGLFDAFRRGGRARTGQKGAGLGLSIVRAIVDAHHGRIQARALPEGGLEVEIELPAKSALIAPVRA